MKKIDAIKTIRINGFTPKSNNNLYIRTKDGVVRTAAYLKWGRKLKKILPDKFLPDDMSNYGLYIEVGIMEEFDLDNTLKSIIDALQKKYKFNDRQLKFLKAKKVVTGSYFTHDYSKDYVQITLLEPITINYEKVENIDVLEFDEKEFRLHLKNDWYPNLTKIRVEWLELVIKKIIKDYHHHNNNSVIELAKKVYLKRYKDDKILIRKTKDGYGIRIDKCKEKEIIV